MGCEKSHGSHHLHEMLMIFSVEFISCVGGDRGALLLLALPSPPPLPSLHTRFDTCLYIIISKIYCNFLKRTTNHLLLL